jgi:hypothetical protein
MAETFKPCINDGTYCTFIFVLVIKINIVLKMYTEQDGHHFAQKTANLAQKGKQVLGVQLTPVWRPVGIPPP